MDVKSRPLERCRDVTVMLDPAEEEPGEISDAPPLSDDDVATPKASRRGTASSASIASHSVSTSERKFKRPSERTPEEKRELTSIMREAKARKALKTHKTKSKEAVEAFNAASRPISGLRLQRVRLEVLAASPAPGSPNLTNLVVAGTTAHVSKLLLKASGAHRFF